MAEVVVVELRMVVAAEFRVLDVAVVVMEVSLGEVHHLRLLELTVKAAAVAEMLLVMELLVEMG
jgi:hypothetical protein